MFSTGDRRQLGKVVSHSITDSDFFGNGSGQFLFTGFSDREASVNRTRANRRIFVLQAAKLALLEMPSRPSGLSLSFSSRGSSSDAISSAPSSGTLKFYGRRHVCLLDFNDTMRPQVVVRRASSAIRSVASCVPTGFSLLVLRFGSGLGCTSSRSLCLGPLVSGGESCLYQSERAQSDSSRSSSLPTSNCWLNDWCVLGQHHSSSLCSQPGRNFVIQLEQGSSAASLVGRDSSSVSSASICHGVSERLGGLLESEKSGHWFGMDADPGGIRRSVTEVASNDRSVCDLPQLSSFSLFFSDGSGHRCSSPTMERHASVCFSSICSDQRGSQQGEGVAESSNIGGSLVATEGMVSRPSESIHSSSDSSSVPSRPAVSTSFPSSSSSAPRASASRVETVQRFTRELGFSRAVAHQLSHCHRPSSQRLYQHCWKCYRQWCMANDHTVSSPSIAKVADFLLFLRKIKHLSISSVKGF